MLTPPGNPLGIVYVLNFSTPFHTSDNISSVLTGIPKASPGGIANNFGQNYYDGALLANDFEWISYGGLVTITDAFVDPTPEGIYAYAAYDNSDAPQFTPGYIPKTLPNPLTRYITYGAEASAPSENLGFYFSGLRASNFGKIYGMIDAENASENADTISNEMIRLDLSTEPKEGWTNLTLPTNVPGRASAELVWVPVSERGILVAVGGVIDPSYANINLTNTPEVNAISVR
jgi:hypothetical protein